MKAIVYHHYGPPDVLQYEDTEQPIPADNQVLIRVRAAAVNPLDRMMRGKPYLMRIMTGLRRPKDIRLGRDVAGEVTAIGRNVTRFKPGDAVFGVCAGAYAEYACASETKLALKPDNVTFEQAAAVPVAALTALQGLRDKGELQPGQHVLINGASGGVGTFAVQIAKSFGADVTAVCSTRNVELVQSIGADRVVDYGREDFTMSAQHYDLIFDAVGNRSLSSLRRLLKPNGKYLAVGMASDHAIGLVARLLAIFVLSHVVSEKLIIFMAKITVEDLTFIAELMKSGKVTPVIDRRFPLNEIARAISYLDEGHARGKIVISVA
jgi:NADPH:quinone reductase-like Zn-dependent oxidoreductase